MKKIIFAAIVITAVLTAGCYDDDKNATVRINLGNIPVARNAEKKSFLDRIFSVFVKDAYAQTLGDEYGVQNLYLAAYSGNTILSTRIIKGSDIALDGSFNCYVEFSVPAADDVRILVLGEVNGEAYYMGLQENAIKLKAGDSDDITISVQYSSDWIVNTNQLTWNSNANTLTWNKVELPVKYQIYFNEYSPVSTTLLYEGSGIQADSPPSANGCDTISFYIIFEGIEIKAGATDQNMFGGC